MKPGMIWPVVALNAKRFDWLMIGWLLPAFWICVNCPPTTTTLPICLTTCDAAVEHLGRPVVGVVAGQQLVAGRCLRRVGRGRSHGHQAGEHRAQRQEHRYGSTGTTTVDDLVHKGPLKASPTM